MRCPRGHNGASLTTPDYGFGYGAEFACYQCDPYGRRFASKSAEAMAESSASRGTSSANAQTYQERTATEGDTMSEQKRT